MKLRHSIIYSEKNTHCAFPSLAILNNEIFVAFRQEPKRRSKTHINTRSKAVIKKSIDKGKSWTLEGKVSHPKYNGIQDLSLFILKNKLALSYFTWQNKQHTTKRKGSSTAGIWITTVKKGGGWKKPILVKPNALSLVTSQSPVIVQGDILIPCYSNTGGGGDCALLIWSSEKNLRRCHHHQKIAHDKTGDLDFQEPSLLDLGDGHLLCLLRTNSPFLYQVHSWDNGRSWEPYKNTKMKGVPPNLLRLKDGRILATYGYRKKPFGIRACTSSDNGLSWNTRDEIILRLDGGGWDIGYPSTVQLNSSKLLTAYYFYTSKNKTRRIECTKWNINKV